MSNAHDRRNPKIEWDRRRRRSATWPTSTANMCEPFPA